MGLFESIFDVAYLILVVALGIRLLLESTPGARQFGIMAILLGLGDGFHLLPRIMSHLSPGGFAAHESALSWGQFVTSITMTIFYVLYFNYYKRISNKNSKSRDALIYGLALVRIVLVLMPQNDWGSFPGNYTFGILRNIPFAIMGILLILWTWQDRKHAGLKYMAELIFLSFLFYIPVVLWVESIPALGALMMPKTMAYLLLVVVGYRHFVHEFHLINLLKIAFVFLVMGLAGGVFFREFTKFNHFSEPTSLGVLHVHSIVLGFLGLTVLWLISQRWDVKVVKEQISRPIQIWVGGLYFMLVMLAVRGISQVIGGDYRPFPDAALAGIAGLSHIALGVALVWTFVSIIKVQTSVDCE